MKIREGIVLHSKLYIYDRRYWTDARLFHYGVPFVRILVAYIRRACGRAGSASGKGRLIFSCAPPPNHPTIQPSQDQYNTFPIIEERNVTWLKVRSLTLSRADCIDNLTMSATTSAIPSPDPNSPEWSIYLDNQSFNVTGLDGSPTTLSFPEINALTYLIGVEAACAGFAVGFVSMLFIVLLLVTPAAKIRKPIFLLNLTSLFLVAFREIVVIAVLCQSTEGVGQFFLGAIAQYSKTIWSADFLSGILGWIIYGTVMTSLVLQVRVVFAAEPRTRMIFTIFGAIAVNLESGFTLTWVVFNIRGILGAPIVRPF